MPAPTHRIPFKTLVSFGAMVFTGGSAPANTDNDSTAITAKPSVDRPRHQVPGNPYGVSAYGYSAGPFKGITMEWTVMIVAAGGLSDAASFQAVEDCYNTWYTAWTGTHTHKSIAGVSGQVGMLVAQDAYGRIYQAEAELTDFPTNNQPGAVATMDLTLVFVLNEDWSYVSG